MIALMTGGVGCPDENALVRFSTGQLSGPDLGGLERHLDTCSSCRSLVAQLASGATGPTSPAGRPDEPVVRHGHVGRYQVERLVGGGGMGMVYAARDKELNRVVAIKLLRTSALANVESRSRLLREAQTMAKLSHPNLVPIFELGSDQGDDFLAMELIDGPTLDLWLREAKRDWRDVVKIFIEAGRGLEAAHQAGVVHRDFKPGNVLVGPDGRARVTDFGLARPMVPTLAAGAEAGSIELTREGSLLGTPAYMAPEQLEGQVADVRSDQFGFCVALAEALIGHRPFPGRTLEDLRKTMRSGKPPELALEPARLKRALLKGMSISADARFESMGALLEELGLVLKPSRANARAVAGGMTLAVVLAASAGLVWQQMNRPAPAAQGERKAVTLAMGEEQVLPIAGVEKITAFDGRILEAAITADRQVALLGTAPGRTTLVMQTRSSSEGPLQQVEWVVQVEDTGAARTQELHLVAGVPGSLTIPGVTRIAIGDISIVEGKLNDSTASLTPLTAGTTTLLAWRGVNGQRLQWQITVAPAPEDDGVVRKSMRLAPGMQKVLTIPGIERVAIGDSEIADVKTIGDNQLLLVAGRPGRTTLIVWTKAIPPADQQRLEWDVHIEAKAPPKPESKNLKLFIAGQHVLTVPGIQRVAVGDSTIADVKTLGNDQLLVIGIGAGTTTLIVWTSAVPPQDQSRLEWTVNVAPGVEKPVLVADTPPKDGERWSFRMSVGTQKVITIPGIQRVAVGDSAIADLKTLGNNQLLVMGEGEGTTTLMVWTAKGRLEWDVTVEAK